VRRCALLLLSVAAAAADFELPPKGDDWEALKPDREGVRTLLRTEFPGNEGYAEVRVMTYPLSEALAKKSLEAIARDWAAGMEEPFPEPRTVAEGKATLGDREAHGRDVRAQPGRLTWHVARAGKLLFVFHVIRTGRAVDDKDLDEEIASMRAAFRFLVKEEAAPPKEGASPKDPARPPKPPPVEPEPARKLEFAHWRFECVKPLGLALIPEEKFDKLERDAGVVAKFEARREQALILVRIYAQSRTAQRFTIDELAEQKIERFEETFDEGKRLPPVRDDAFKFPMAERAIRLELSGRKAAAQTTLWLLAQCRNDRQYQVEVMSIGAPGEWDATIRAVVDGFRPHRGQ
jgi:hypothetical protein